MSAEDPTGISKSARKRANKKAREGEAGGEAEEAPAPAPAPAPKAKAVAKEKAKAKAKAAEPPPPAAPAVEPKAKAKGKAKAKAAEAPAPAPPAPKAEAKAKGKAKAAPKAQPVPEPEEPKAAPKVAAKGKAKAKAKSAQEEKEEVVAVESKGGPLVYFEMDDGTRGGDWEVSAGVSKKAQKRKEKVEETKTMVQMQKSGALMEARGNQHIPGLAPAEVQMANAKGGAKAKAKATQSVTAIATVSAAAADNKGKEPEKAAVSDNSVSVTIKVEQEKIGRVVGPKGANIILIKEKTGVKTIDLSGDMCTIIGNPDQVVLAEHAVRQLIEKGFMSLAYDDFEEEGVPLLPSLFPDIIGQKGIMIKEIKDKAKVEITIPAVPKNAPPGKKYKVTLAGSKASVALGKQILEAMEMYGHHEITHPGKTHAEMEVEPWRYAFIIGSKGSEMRHIQNNYGVKVSIPREFSANQNVVIMGEPRGVERAVKHIEKLIFESDQPKGRGTKDQAIDDGGDDGPEEEWMKQYMYQRK